MAQVNTSTLSHLTPNDATSESNRSFNNISIRRLSPPQSPSRVVRCRRARRNGSSAYQKRLCLGICSNGYGLGCSITRAGLLLHFAAHEPPQPGRTGRVITYTGVINAIDGISHFLQFNMGLMLITVLLMRNCLPLLPWLRLYLIGSYVLLVKTSVVIVISLTISGEMGINDRERWRTLLNNVMAMALKLPISFLVKDIYKDIFQTTTATSEVAYVRRPE